MTRVAESLDVAPRSVLGRTFDILDCFTGSEGDQSITSLCARTGLPQATVHRLLATLVEWGAVERSGRGQYRLGMRLWRLGWGVPGARAVRDVARPFMVDLYAATRQAVLLGSRDGDDLLIVDQIAGHAVGRRWRSLRRMPLGAVAPGLVYVAHMGLGELRLRLAESSLGLREELIRDEFLLLQTLAGIRSTGVAVTGLGDHRWVAAPIFSTDGRVRSTLSMLVPDERFALADHRRLIARVARAISEELIPHDESFGVPSAGAEA